MTARPPGWRSTQDSRFRPKLEADAQVGSTLKQTFNETTTCALAAIMDEVRLVWEHRPLNWSVISRLLSSAA